MNLATAILVILSHAGFWVGGQEQSVEFRWSVETPMPAAIVQWDLSVAGTIILKNEVKIPAGDGNAIIKLEAPKVREQTKALFRYRVRAVDGGKELVSDERTIFLCADRLSDLALLTADKPLLVFDKAGGLPDALKRAAAAFETIDSLSGLLTRTPSIIVVGQDHLDTNDPAAAALQALAQTGASVLVLRQTGTRVLQYDLATRDVTGYTIVADHPLLRHLPREAWESFLVAPARQSTLSIPTNEAALELIHSPIEADTVTTAPLDALLLSQSVGTGRIVFCQLPVNEVSTDARQQQLLLNLIEYCRTRPQPTPPRAVRMSEKKTIPAAADSPSIYGR